MTYPLFIVSGLSGSGKSTTAPVLGRKLVDFDVFDMDIIVNDQNFQIACSNWLKIAYSNASCGRGTILFGNVPIPYNIFDCDFFHYFNPIYYLHLHCSDDVRTQRLNARGWRPEDIVQANIAAKEMVGQAQNASPPVPIIDTTNTPVSQVADQIKKWVLKSDIKRIFVLDEGE